MFFHILFILLYVFHDEKCRSLHNAKNLHTVFFELSYNANVGVDGREGIEFLYVYVYKYVCVYIGVGVCVYERIEGREHGGNLTSQEKKQQQRKRRSTTHKSQYNGIN